MTTQGWLPDVPAQSTCPSTCTCDSVLTRPILDGSTLHLHVRLRSQGTNLLSPGWTSLAQPPKLAQLPRAGCRPSNWRAAEGTSEVTENQRWDEARSSGPCLTSFPLTPSLRGTSASRSQDCPSQGRRETRSIPPDKRTNSLTS